MRMAVFFFVAAFIFPSFCMAEWIERSGEKLPDTAFRKSDGSFSSWLVLVPDDRALYSAWQRPGASVQVNETEQVRINEPISAFIVFSGCEADSSGNCDVQMRFRVLAPDGSVYTESPPMEVWQGKMPPHAQVLELSVGYLKVAIESHEQVGNYQVEVQVKDRISGKVLLLQKAFRAARAKTAETGNSGNRTPIAETGHP